MSALVCPNGHASDEPDYCSVCGTPMTAAATPAAPAGTCPTCGTARADAAARYCEVCRYDFDARQPGPAPIAADPPAATSAAATPGTGTPPAGTAATGTAATGTAATGTAAAGTAATGTPAAGGAGSGTPATATPVRWEIVVTVDPSLDAEPDPETPAPTDAGERLFPVDLPEMLVGRRDDRRDIRPEIPVLDPAVSRRHAKLLQLPGGGLAILDLASANGTAVNGTEIPAGERHDLTDGDTVTMGRWTRIAVRHRTP